MVARQSRAEARGREGREATPPATRARSTPGGDTFHQQNRRTQERGTGARRGQDPHERGGEGNPPRTRNNGTHATHCRRDRTGLPSLALPPPHRDAQGGTQASPFAAQERSGAPGSRPPVDHGQLKAPPDKPCHGKASREGDRQKGGGKSSGKPAGQTQHAQLPHPTPNPVLGHRQSRNGPRSRARSTRLGQEPPLHPPQAGRREQRTGG